MGIRKCKISHNQELRYEEKFSNSYFLWTSISFSQAHKIFEKVWDLINKSCMHLMIVLALLKKFIYETPLKCKLKILKLSKD